MIDIAMKVKSLKLSWLRRALINPSSTWKSINDELIHEFSFDMIIRGRGNNLQYIKHLPNFYIYIFGALRTVGSTLPCPGCHD